MSFADTISNLTELAPERHVASIKHAIVNRLRESDRDIEIETTEYFNHGFAPDFVLSWPGEDSRNLHLRTTTRSDYLLEDVELIGESHPIIMPLSDAGLDAAQTVDGPPNRDDNMSAVAERAGVARMMVASPQAIDELSDASRNKPVVRLLSRAVLQGGRGVLGSGGAHAAGEAVGEGFLAAGRGEAEPTGEAVELVDHLLDQTRAARMNRLLHAVWIGSGASPSAFPGATGITATLDATSLQFLLTGVDIDDREFWGRIGAGISFERLCETNVPEQSQNLQRLVSSCLSQFQARACRVHPKQAALDSFELPRWFTGAGLLSLSAARYVAHVSPRGLTEMGLTDRNELPVSLTEMIERSEAARVELSQVDLVFADGRHMDLANGDGPHLTADGFLQGVGESLASGGVAVRAVVATLGRTGRPLRCDLTRRTASGRTVQKYYAIELIGIAIQLLQGLNEREREQLGAALTPIY